MLREIVKLAAVVGLSVASLSCATIKDEKPAVESAITYNADCIPNTIIKPYNCSDAAVLVKADRETVRRTLIDVIKSLKGYSEVHAFGHTDYVSINFLENDDQCIKALIKYDNYVSVTGQSNTMSVSQNDLHSIILIRIRKIDDERSFVTITLNDPIPLSCHIAHKTMLALMR